MLRVFDNLSSIQTLLGDNLLNIWAVRTLYLSAGVLRSWIGEYITPATAHKVRVFDCGSMGASCALSAQ